MRCILLHHLTSLLIRRVFPLGSCQAVPGQRRVSLAGLPAPARPMTEAEIQPGNSPGDTPAHSDGAGLAQILPISMPSEGSPVTKTLPGASVLCLSDWQTQQGIKIPKLCAVIAGLVKSPHGLRNQADGRTSSYSSSSHGASTSWLNKKSTAMVPAHQAPTRSLQLN